MIICGFMALFCLAGCGRHDYKAEADETVYNIIDQKWQDDFGSKVNYKISDTQPSSDDIKIEKAVPASGILTLPQAVSMATANNRLYQLERDNLYIKALDLRLARHEFELSPFGIASGVYSKEDVDESIGAGGTIGFNKLLAGGTIISANLASAWLDIITGDVRSGLTSILTATITQPLLRGSDRRIVLENLTQAERDTLYQIRLFNRFRKTFVVSIITRYYQVLQQYDILKNAEENYRVLGRVHQKTAKLAEAGKLPMHELDQAHQDRLNALDTYVKAEKLYKQTLDEFKIELAMPTEFVLRLDADELKAVRAVGIFDPNFSEDQAVEAALKLRLDLANSSDAVTDAERKVIVAADNLKPELNLVATTTVPSREISSSAAKELNDVFSGTLQLDLGLDKELEVNLYRKALITLNQRKRLYEEAADLVVLEVRTAYRDLTEAAELYRVQLKGLELAEQRFSNTLILLDFARANTRDVLDAQEDLFDARNASTEALIGYTIATLNFYRDAGVLNVRPDGMWE